MTKKVWQVFGISNDILPDSYVDRGDLDEALGDLLTRGQSHIALRGASKCGKSWLRRKLLANPIVVQCRLGKTSMDIYTDALSQLDVSFHTESKSSQNFKGTVKATGSIGASLLGKLGLEVGGEAGTDDEKTSAKVGKDINDLRFVADIIKASGRRLVIEDFHYLSLAERRSFAFDLKAFWDWGVQVIIVGVWSTDNLLLSLNPDLSGRIEELVVIWTDSDLGRILDKGGDALNLSFEGDAREILIKAAFGNSGQIQTLVLRFLELAGINEAPNFRQRLSDKELAQHAAMRYAEQLNSLYQNFAENIASGIRSRKNSTGIYAHTMAVIMASSDSELIKGLSVDRIFAEASRREPRVLLGNLKSILTKIEALQIDQDGRGLVLSYNANSGVSVVDRQLLLYRRYATVSWPWEGMIAQSSDGETYQADQS